jgi:uncharacterized membrane protein
VVVSRPGRLTLTFFAAYTALSVCKHRHLGSGAYDLGIFTQAVRSYAELQPPVSELKGARFNLLGDHFHPILATLAPAYRLFPTPVTLLVAQAALFAISIIPVARLAADRFGERAGSAVGLAYGLSWGIQRAVRFDFHEIAFAVPLLAFSLEQLARRRWAAAVAWAVPLVTVKEDLGITVAAIGAYIFCQGARRLGAAVVAGASAATVLTVLVIIPAFNPAHRYPYQDTAAWSGNPLLRLVMPVTKEQTMVALLLPTAFLVLRSPLALLVLPTLGWRFWATNPAYWGTAFHYNAVLMPVIFVAFSDGLSRLSPAKRPVNKLLRQAAVPCSVIIVIVGTVAGPSPLARLADPATWELSPQVRAARAALAVIPDGADVAAANRLAPQLVARCHVSFFPSLGCGDRCSRRNDFAARRGSRSHQSATVGRLRLYCPRWRHHHLPTWRRHSSTGGIQSTKRIRMVGQSEYALDPALAAHRPGFLASLGAPSVTGVIWCQLTSNPFGNSFGGGIALLLFRIYTAALSCSHRRRNRGTTCGSYRRPG